MTKTKNRKKKKKLKTKRKKKKTSRETCHVETKRQKTDRITTKNI